MPWDVANDSEGNPIEVNSDNLDGKPNQRTWNGVWCSYASDLGQDDHDLVNESSKELDVDLGIEPKMNSDTKEEKPPEESKPEEE